ncbi:lectin like domain-containing protein [Eubacterium ventriosum]|uniref:lectin like domain-containing protein n=1 Tax=Eubacterium ventriosum TaxID=39496 RepID=UPI003991DE54
MYVEVTNITDNQLTFKIEGDFEEQQTEIKEISDREKYDGRDDGIVTPVKDQGDTNLCWAYSSIAAAESSILKSGIDPTVTKDTLSLNPMAAAYRVFKRESDPLGNTDGDWQSVNYLTQSGDPLKIAKLYSMWWAPVSGNVVTTNPYENPSYRFENAIYIPENKSNPEEYIRSIKKAIAKYGAVTFQYNNARETLYYNPKNEHGSTISPHACTIIGWDDNIPSDKFVPNGATQKGGWLVKNSYKSLEYFWLSYDNTSSCSYAFSFAPKDKYDFNYYYDGSMDDFPLRKDKSVANVFKAKKSDDLKDEYIKAVNVAIGGENVTAKVEIYKNVDYPYGGQDNVPVSGGYLANTTTAYFENSGYVTIELNQPVKIEKDQWFSAIVSVSNENGDAKIMTSYKNGREMSYINNGSGWTQLKNYVGRIKVYTKLENKVENPTIEVPTTEAPTTAEVTTTLKPTTEVTTTLEPTTEKQTETTVTVEPTTEILTTENTTSETTVENQTTDETTSEKESTTTFGQVVTKENEPTTNGKTTTRVDGVNKKSLKQTKILKVKKLKNRKVRITFKKVSKAKIYRIQYSTDRKFKKNVRTKRTGKTTYLLRKLRVRKRYYVRVRAIVGKDKGKWSSVKSFKVSKRFYK